MAKLQVKGWGDFQHYKDRSPPWIKLHKSLLDNYEYQCLPVASRALAPMLWLLASENNDGSFDGDIKKLAFRLRTTEKEVIEGLEPLIQAGFVVSDSDVLAECKRDAMPETEKRQRRDRVEKNALATRLPTDWMPSDADREFCEQERPDLNVKGIADGFRDYWHGIGGAKGRKLDWSATWRNWVRNQRKEGKPHADSRADVIAAFTGRRRESTLQGAIEGDYRTVESG